MLVATGRDCHITSNQDQPDRLGHAKEDAECKRRGHRPGWPIISRMRKGKHIDMDHNTNILFTKAFVRSQRESSPFITGVRE